MTLSENYQEDQDRDGSTAELIKRAVRDLVRSRDDDGSSIEGLVAPMPGFNFLTVPHNKRAVSAIMYVKEEYIDEVAALVSEAIEAERSYLVLRKSGYFCFMLNLTFNKIAALLAIYFFTHKSYPFIKGWVDLISQ